MGAHGFTCAACGNRQRTGLPFTVSAWTLPALLLLFSISGRSGAADLATGVLLCTESRKYNGPNGRWTGSHTHLPCCNSSEAEVVGKLLIGRPVSRVFTVGESFKVVDGTIMRIARGPPTFADKFFDFDASSIAYEVVFEAAPDGPCSFTLNHQEALEAHQLYIGLQHRTKAAYRKGFKSSREKERRLGQMSSPKGRTNSWRHSFTLSTNKADGWLDVEWW